MRAGRRRTDLRAGTAGDVRAGVENVFDLNFNGRDGAERVAMATSSCRPSRNIRGTISNMPTPTCCSSSSAWRRRRAKNISRPAGSPRHFLPRMRARAGRRARRGRNRRRHRLALPAYDQCIKASHVFNLLDARGVISVTERQSYILRVRELAKACGEAWLATDGGGLAMSGSTPERREPNERSGKPNERAGEPNERTWRSAAGGRCPSTSWPAKAIGGAPAAARNRSRSATAPTRAPSFGRRNGRPKPARKGGSAPASAPRTSRYATAAIKPCRELPSPSPGGGGSARRARRGGVLQQ